MSRQPATDARAGSPPTPRRLRLRTVALGALIPCSLLVLGEGLLRLAGIGADLRTSELAYQEVFTPALVPGQRPAGEPILQTWDPRHAWQAVEAVKPARSLRVLCFGGSATAGLGYSPNVTFVRQLEDLLRAAHPSRTVEVLNLAVVGIAAKQVRVLVEDALARYEPDLVVVYSGNNEFLAVHAARYFALHASLRRRLAGQMRELHLVRALRRGLRGPPDPTSVPLRDLALSEEARLTHTSMLQGIQISAEEHDRTLAGYRAELELMAQAARRAGVPLLIVGVAVNWEWVGPLGLPDDWIEDLLGRPGTPAQAVAELDAQIARGKQSAYERWQALSRRATAKDLLGDVAGATADWRASSNVDPYQRRATDSHLAAARAAAEAAEMTFLDGVALCVADDPRARSGFRHFYDYVHFTPRGAMVVAQGVFRAMQGIEGLPRPEVDLAQDVDGLTHILGERSRRIRDAQFDFIAREEFIGFCFEPQSLHSTDLWKYDTAVRELDERIGTHPDDWRALAYRGNARSFTTVGAAGAAEDWRRALELCPEAGEKAQLQMNLQWLLARRPVSQ